MEYDNSKKTDEQKEKTTVWDGSVTFDNTERLKMMHLLINGMFHQHDFATVQEILDKLYHED